MSLFISLRSKFMKKRILLLYINYNITIANITIAIPIIQ